MKVTILGCGNSGGVPLVGNDWGTCDPKNPRNRRRRVSILVEEGETTLLVDTSPDLRQQLLDCNLNNLTAVLYTHTHADHTHGIDDLRSVNWLTQKAIPIYANAETMTDLQTRFGYIFFGSTADRYCRPLLEGHTIDNTMDMKFGSTRVTSFTQHHGPNISIGYRFNDFAYSTDVNRLDDAAFNALAGIKVWVVDCIRENPHRTHSHLEQTLEWIKRVKPERAILTHMDQSMDYETLVAKLPKGIEPAYDGLEIQC